MHRIKRENTRFFSLWTLFEPNAFDGQDAKYVNANEISDATGRFIPYVLQLDGQERAEPLNSYDIPGAGDYYLVARNSGKDNITPPYYYEALGQTFYITSAAVPIKKDNKVIGVAGADLALDSVSDTLDKIKILDSGYAILLDQFGNIVHHPQRQLRSKPFGPQESNEVAAAVAEVYRSKQTKVIQAPSKVTGQETIFAIAPFEVSDTGLSWVVILSVPLDEALAPVYSGVYMIVALGCCLIIISIGFLYLMIAGIIRTLTRITDGLEETSEWVNSASGQFSSSSQSLAEGVTEQAASLEETSSTLEEMASMTRQNADNANKTSDTMKNTASLFEDGSKHM